MPRAIDTSQEDCAALFSDNEASSVKIIDLLENENRLRISTFSYMSHESHDLAEPPHPSLFIMDICRFDLYRTRWLRRIANECPGVPIITLLRDGEAATPEDASRTGAAGFLPLQNVEENLIEAVRTVLSGNMYMSQQLYRSTIRNLRDRKSNLSHAELATLSGRELEVFGTIANGLTTREAASKLSINIKTVETYKLRIREKLSLKSAQELSHYATRQMEDHRPQLR